jgi:hypothetical protein
MQNEFVAVITKCLIEIYHITVLRITVGIYSALYTVARQWYIYTGANQTESKQADGSDSLNRETQFKRTKTVLRKVLNKYLENVRGNSRRDFYGIFQIIEICLIVLCLWGN